MIPKCIVDSANYYYPTKRYDLALKKADQETPSATRAEKVITTVALSALTASCLSYPLAGCPTNSHSLVIYLGGCLGSIFSCSANDFPYIMDHPNFPKPDQDQRLSTGCIRDFTILKKIGRASCRERVYVLV